MTRIASVLFVLGFVVGAAGAPLPEPSRAKEPAVPRELLQAQLAAAQEVFKARWEEFQAGRASLDGFQDWMRRLLDARLAVATKGEERVAACKEYLEHMKEIEKVAKARFDAGRSTIADYKGAVYFRIEAEILLFKAEAK